MGSRLFFAKRRPTVSGNSPPTPGEVEENVRIARQFKTFGEEQMRLLQKRTSAQASALTYYKMP